MMEKFWCLIWLLSFVEFVSFSEARVPGEQPLSNIAIHRTILALDGSAYVKASPLVLGLKVIRAALMKFAS